MNVLPEGEDDTLVGPGTVQSFTKGTGRRGRGYYTVVLDATGHECCPSEGFLEELEFFHVLEAAPVPAPVAPTVPGANPKAALGATKPSIGLIPPVAELHEAMAFEDGARKYGAFNWRTNPVEAMTYVHAIKRHLGLWLDGQEYTTDTNVHNLGAIRASCGILLDCIENGTLIDNRPPPGASEAVQVRLKAQKVQEAAARAGK